MGEQVVTGALQVETIHTPELGNRGYVVHDRRSAVVVDPQRDIDRVQEVLERRSLVCAAVLETHVHNDYLTGGLALAREWGADYLVNAAEPVRFERRGVVDGEQLPIGGLGVTVLATPGHTEGHLAYLVEDGRGGAGALLTGGSMLYGAVGRTDLVDPDRTEELTRSQFRSVRRLAELPPETLVLPTHGFGSFCSAGGGSDSATSSGALRDELTSNPALTATDEDAFVTRTIAGLGTYPAYYRYMAAANLAGPSAADVALPPPATVGTERIVVDIRPRREYAAAHLPGSVGVELGPQLATYVGWLLPWRAPITLLATDTDQVRAATRQLARIGFDDLRSMVGVPAEAVASSYAVSDFAGLAAARADGQEVVVLDVRTAAEHADGAIPGALHLELPELISRLEELPAGDVWVHCASGYRASIAASLLHAAGRRVTLVDDLLAQ